MPSFVVAILLLAVLSTVQAGVSKEEALKILSKCKDETKATEDINKMVEEQSLPTTHEGKCMLVCALREKGVMKGDSIDKDAMSKAVEDYYGDEPEKMEQAAEMIAKCSTLDTSGLEVCEKIFKIASCAKEGGFRM